MEQLEKNWRAVLPGFTKTAHHIDSVKVDIEEGGLKATTKSNVLAYHFLSGAEEGEGWTLIGTYNHELARFRLDAPWKITKMALNVDQQFGNLKLLV